MSILDKAMKKKKKTDKQKVSGDNASDQFAAEVVALNKKSASSDRDKRP